MSLIPLRFIPSANAILAFILLLSVKTSLLESCINIFPFSAFTFMSSFAPKSPCINILPDDDVIFRFLFVTITFFSGVTIVFPSFVLSYTASTPIPALRFFKLHEANKFALIFSFSSLIFAKFSPSFITTPCSPIKFISSAAPILLPTDTILSPSIVTVLPLELIILPILFILSISFVFLFCSTPANIPFLFPVIFKLFDVCTSYLLLISFPDSISTPFTPFK